MKSTGALDLFSVPYRRESATSREAAEAIGPSGPRLRHLVLDAYQRHGPMTADECAERVGLSILACRPRVSELRKAGRLVLTGERRANASGLRAAVLRAVL